MKPIYIAFNGDLYTFIVDITGEPESIEVAYGNRSMVGQPIDEADVPLEVMERFYSKFVNQFDINNFL